MMNPNSTVWQNLVQTIKPLSLEESYQTLTLSTERKDITCRYYPVESSSAKSARNAVIWVTGVGGGWASPAAGLYPELCRQFQNEGIASLHVRYRCPTILEECTFDVLTGCRFLEAEGFDRIGMVGHSSGGAVVIQAAAFVPSVKTVITIASQSYGTEQVNLLGPRCSLLLLHGTKDPVLPEYCSEQIYAQAQDPKKLILLPGNDHCLEQSVGEVRTLVSDWLVNELSI